MTKQEFETLTGREYTDKAFDQINEMYMNAGDHVTKQNFADMYIAAADERIAFATKVSEEKVRTASILLKKSEKYGDDDLRQEAVNLIGKWNAARLALKLGLPLRKEERDFVSQILQHDSDSETRVNESKIMKVKAFFSNSCGDCRLCITFADGHHRHVLFESVSSLLNYDREQHLDLVMTDCHTEE